MYDPILLTLDGSDLSAWAIPHAVAVAKGMNARLILLCAVGKGKSSGATRERKKAEEYLEKQVETLRAQGVNAESICKEGNPVDVILETIGSTGAQLVVIATHGRSGISRIVFGSVAVRVVGSSPVPVLLVRALPEKTTRTAVTSTQKDVVEEASDESFPASDPPSPNPGAD